MSSLMLPVHSPSFMGSEPLLLTPNTGCAFVRCTEPRTESAKDDL